MVSLRGATPASLDAYEEGIRQLAEAYPGCWGLIVRADETMRSEEWEVDQMRLVSLGVAASDWSLCIAQSAYGAEVGSKTHWWFARVVSPALYHRSAGSAAQSSVDRAEGLLTSTEEAVGSDRSGSVGNNGTKGKGNSKGGKGDKGKTRPDVSQETCNKWNQSAKGCKNKCPFGRRHVCDKCGGPHRGVDCTPGAAAPRG